jgi:hypothetical protein
VQKQLEEQQKAAREQQMAILQQFVDSGGKDRLKAVLRERLQEAGWKEGVKELCKEVMRNNRIEGVTVDELVASTMPRARGTLKGRERGWWGQERNGRDVGRKEEDGMPNRTHMYIYTYTYAQPRCQMTYDWKRSRPLGTPCRPTLGESS